MPMKCFELRMLYSSWSIAVSSSLSGCTEHFLKWTVQPMCMGDYGVQTRGDARAAYLAGGIDDLGGIFLVLVADDLAERVLDGGIVALDEVAVDELHRQARFAWAVRRVPGGVGGSTHRRLC